MSCEPSTCIPNTPNSTETISTHRAGVCPQARRTVITPIARTFATVLMSPVQTPAAVTTASVANPASNPSSRPHANSSERRALAATVINWTTT